MVVGRRLWRFEYNEVWKDGGEGVQWKLKVVNWDNQILETLAKMFELNSHLSN